MKYLFIVGLFIAVSCGSNSSKGKHLTADTAYDYLEWSNSSNGPTKYGVTTSVIRVIKDSVIPDPDNSEKNIKTKDTSYLVFMPDIKDPLRYPKDTLGFKKGDVKKDSLGNILYAIKPYWILKDAIIQDKNKVTPFK